jgi:diguanylate cyclase (GGDEF)-like protein
MATPLRVLLVEDSEDDALLLLRELRKGGYAPESLRVDTGADLEAALARGPWDIVITDHNLPGFSSAAALATVKRAAGDIPVIIVSGSIGEDIAVAAMKSGAHDYIMKGNLARLVPAIARELREAETRHAHRRAQETIQHLAFHDVLTGLANRHEFETRLKHAVESVRHGGRHALLYLDLDQFKIINDTCGHTAGDELLRQLAMLLKQPIRDNDTLARLGGDEFGVLLARCSLDHAQSVAERMLQLIRDFRFTWLERTFNIGASIGLVMIGDATHTLTDLLRAADMACYAAKDKGRNRVHVYHPGDAELARRHGEMEWVGRLNEALAQDRFELHYQRIIALSPAQAAVTHQELLLRLRDADQGLILPGAFIPAAERYNLMPQLDRWVVRRALDCLAAQRARAGSQTGMCFINLSGATVSDDEFFRDVSALLRAHDVPPHMICFEITETAAIANLASAIDFIEQAKALGCRIALDDFGAGLSSFSYLKTIPADFLKIDGSFVADMLRDPMDNAIVEAIHRIARVAGLQTIAEFVESGAIRQRLVEIGVDYAQGYGIHPPEALAAAAGPLPAAATRG